MNYTYLEKNWHIIQGDKTACGMDIPDDAETAAPQLAPQCRMCWLRRYDPILEEILDKFKGEFEKSVATLTNDPNTWGETVRVRAYDAEDTAALLSIDYTPVSS